MNRGRSIRASRLLVTVIVLLLVTAQPAGAAGPRAADVVPNFPHLTFTSSPGAATGGQEFASQPVVHDVDAGGNPRVGDAVTIGILPGTGAPGAVLTCNAMTLLTDASGDATFTNCFIDKAGTGYRLSAQVLAVSTAASSSAAFDVAVGPPSQLAFVSQPIDAFVGHPFDLVVGITDAGRNVVSSGTSATITLAIGPDNAGDIVLSCPGGLSRPTVTSGPGAGTATFTGCTLDVPFVTDDDITIQATATGVTGAGGLTSAQSAGIGVGAAADAPLPGLVLTPSATTTISGQPVTLTVAFAGGGGRDVELQGSADATTWTTIARARTDSTGRATFVHRPRTTLYLRAAFDGPPLAASGSSDLRTVLVRLSATQSPTHATATIIRRGTTITFATTVRPVGSDVAVPRVQFLLFRRVNGVWSQTISRTFVTNSSGVARFTWRFATAGEYYVRSKALGTWHGATDQAGANVESVLTPIARYVVK